MELSELSDELEWLLSDDSLLLDESDDNDDQDDTLDSELKLDQDELDEILLIDDIDDSLLEDSEL